MAKRKKNDLLHEPAKKNKVENGKEDEPTAKVIAGRSENLTSRENELFDSIVDLVTKDKTNQFCASCSNLLSEAGSVLAMEFDNDMEVLQLWLKSSTGPRVRFLVHPIHTIEAAAPVPKRPLISFSDNFVDSEHSRIVKSVLSEIFKGETYGEDPDYLYAFSRRGNFVHLRTYQVLEVPNLSAPKKKLKLSSVVKHICFTTMSFTTSGLNEAKTPKAFTLLEDRVFIGNQSVGMLHSALFKGTVVLFVLDDLIDLSSWDGFATCLSDFKERNTAIFTGRLLGDAKRAMISYPNERYKALIRSLLIETLGLHGKELCFHKISDSDVCLCGTTVKLSWTIELLEYDTATARSNRRDIRALIINMFKDLPLPRDLEVLLELLDCEYMVPSDYLITHCSLMDDTNKSHMINDIYMEFTSNLTTRHKLLVAEPLCYYINNWKELIKSNVLLSGISSHRFGLEKNPDVALSKQSVEIASVEGHSNRDEVEADGDNSDPTVQKVRAVTKLVTFVRHCNVHLPDQVKSQFKQPQIKIQRREIVRIIASKLQILHILQNELRNIFGDKWFAKYFNRQ